MNLAIHITGQDSGARPVERVGFDMLRAMVCARQAGTATVRALTAAHAIHGAASDHGVTDTKTTTLALLNGRRTAGNTLMGGAFADHVVCGHPVGNEGELHG